MKFLAQIEGLNEIEQLIKEKIKSEAPVLSEISAHLVNLGGKRIRPALCLLCAKVLGMQKPSEDLLSVATGIELIHSATLLHDDIIDKSPIRRKEISAYRKYGLPGTLLAGDFLLVRAFALCAKLDEHVISATEEACVELTEGEILETPLYESDHSIESALVIAKKKTASLFRLAAQSAAYISGASRETENMMRTFGEELGIAFQMLDDVLDITGNASTSGKAAGVDIRERKPSIVNMLWLETKSPLSRSLLSAPNSSEDSFVEEAIREIKDCGILEKASNLAHQYATQAEGSLKQAILLHKGPINDAAYAQVLSIINFVVERIH